MEVIKMPKLNAQDITDSANIANVHIRVSAEGVIAVSIGDLQRRHFHHPRISREKRMVHNKLMRILRKYTKTA